MRIKRHFCAQIREEERLQKVLSSKEVFLSICLGAGPIEAAPAANGQNHDLDGIEPLGNVPMKSIVNYHPTQSATQKMQSSRDECTHVDKGALKEVF